MATMRRHDLIRVAPSDWELMLSAHPGLHDLPLVQDWALQGWPVIIRRPIPGDRAGATPAALPLPPCFGKRRVSFSLPEAAGIAAVPPVLLEEAAGAAPVSWRPAIAALLALGRDVGAAPRVYGAVLWEHLTGLPYLTATSDLDLLWRVKNARAAGRLLAGLRHIDAAYALRIDGELELTDGAGVNWRELAACGFNGQSSVLAKSMQAVTVRCAAHLFEPVTCNA